MSDFLKVGLLIVKNIGGKKKFLVCQKDNFTSQYIMPGGQIDKDDEIECLREEIREELDSSFDSDKLSYLGTYEDVAAGAEDRKVIIKLYKGELLENPKPSSEIIKLIWLGKNDDLNDVSPVIKNKIIPDLEKRKINAGTIL